jgi:hypothetical protein
MTRSNRALLLLAFAALIALATAPASAAWKLKHVYITSYQTGGSSGDAVPLTPAPGPSGLQQGR